MRSEWGEGEGGVNLCIFYYFYKEKLHFIFGYYLFFIYSK